MVNEPPCKSNRVHSARRTVRRKGVAGKPRRYPVVCDPTDQPLVRDGIPRMMEGLTFFFLSDSSSIIPPNKYYYAMIVLR